MEMPQNDFDRIVFAELARKSAEADHAGNPHDADNLTKWGSALMELSQCQDGDGCVRMLEDAVSKLEAALLIDPGKHEALYVLGNAFTARGFYNQDAAEARVYFDKATACFLQAVEEDPGNGNYLSALNMASQASTGFPFNHISGMGSVSDPAVSYLSFIASCGFIQGPRISSWGDDHGSTKAAPGDAKAEDKLTSFYGTIFRIKHEGVKEETGQGPEEKQRIQV